MTESGRVAGGCRRGASAIVLAGGRSSRFGSSKLDADLGGATVLDLTIQAVGTLATEVIVVGRSVPDRVGPPPVRFVEDRAPFEGPLGGLAVGLPRATQSLVVVVAGDMPLVRAAVLRAMLERLADLADSAGWDTGMDADAVVLGENRAARPLPVVLRRMPGLRAAENATEAGERSLRQLLARLRLDVIAEQTWRRIDPDGDTLLDIDTPRDLERARTRRLR